MGKLKHTVPNIAGKVIETTDFILDTHSMEYTLQTFYMFNDDNEIRSANKRIRPSGDNVPAYLY